MEWRSGKNNQVWLCNPYRIEKVRYKHYLYKSEKLPDGSWNMRIVGKYEDLEDAKLAAEEDAKLAAEEDAKQGSLWG